MAFFTAKLSFMLIILQSVWSEQEVPNSNTTHEFGCCSWEMSYENTISANCDGINSASDIECVTKFMQNLTATTDLGISFTCKRCNTTLFENDYLLPYNVVGLGFTDCGLTQVPYSIFGDFSNRIFVDLRFSNNAITVIPPDGFAGCTKLEELDLSANHIANISEDSFKSLNSLTLLYLQYNYITKVDGFHGLSSVASLFLSHNLIVEVAVNAFQDLKVIGILDLSYNNITTLEEGVFNGLHTLNSLNLINNPFNCTCSLVWLQEWIIDRQLATDTTCASPYSAPILSIPMCSSSTPILPTINPTSTSTWPTTVTKTVITNTTITSQLPTSPSNNNDDDGSGNIINNFTLCENLTLTWQSTESKVMILYSPVRENCTKELIDEVFGGLESGVHAVILENQTEYQIRGYDDSIHPYMVCITAASFNDSFDDLICGSNCLNTFSSPPPPDNDVPSTVPPQSVLSLSIAIGLICAVILVGLIIMTSLFCLMRSARMKERACHVSESTLPVDMSARPLPATPSGHAQTCAKCRVGNSNPLYKGCIRCQQDVYPLTPSYLCLESEPEQEMNAPSEAAAPSDTYDSISANASHKYEVSADLITTNAKDDDDCVYLPSTH